MSLIILAMLSDVKHQYQYQYSISSPVG